MRKKGLREANRTAKASAVEFDCMEAHIALDQPNRVSKAMAKKTRTRCPLPPLEAREWMTASETALTLGCSVATLHRLRRGLILGVEPLPCSQYGRKVVFRKASVACWQDTNEQRGLTR